MNAREELTKKVEELKEKYKNVINDLSMKYDKDLSVAFYMLIAIPSAINI
jgi:archaellum component FlaC